MKRNKKRIRKKLLSIIIPLVLIVLFAFAAIIAVSELEKQFYPREYKDYVEQYADEYDVPPELVYAVIQTESNFEVNARSGAGAQGLMQLMPETLEWISRNLLKEPEPTGDILDPETNIKYGTYYLHYLKERFGNWETAVAAYNAGHNRVESWLSDSRYSDDGETLKHIPITETRNYVEKVFASRDEYADIYYKKD